MARIATKTLIQECASRGLFVSDRDLRAENARLREAMYAVVEALNAYADGPATPRELEAERRARAALRGE